MQSLFNPNFLGLGQHLLQHASIATLGIGAWWTLFVLTLHTVWSIPVSIAISEALVPARAEEPWLNGVGIAMVFLIFAVGCVAIGNFTVRNDAAHFIASPLQVACAFISIVLLIVLAFLRSSPRAVRKDKAAPRPSIIGFVALLASSIFLAVPARWGWWAISLYVVLDVVTIRVILTWSRMKNWGAMHRLALSGGAAIAYGLHSFAVIPAVGHRNRIGNAAFIIALLAALYLAAGQIRQMHGGSR